MKHDFKQLGLFLFVLLMSACSNKPPSQEVAKKTIDQAKFASLYRAAKSMEAAIGVGVNYEKLGQLLQEMATEVSIAKDKAALDEERALVSVYAEVLQAYQDSHTLWQVKIDSSKYEWLGGQIPYVLKGEASKSLAPIVERYHLKVSNSVKQFPDIQTISPDAIQTVWAAARPLLEKANKLYYSQPLSDQSVK